MAKTFKRSNVKRGDFTTIVAVVADERPVNLHADFVETTAPNALDGLTHIDTMTQCGNTIRRYGYL